MRPACLLLSHDANPAARPVRLALYSMLYLTVAVYALH